ncbi:MAG: hypothetical protein HUU35_14315, partial [Armatimonadetes bacterium]|nr:hypothetical protein [Armatimonadota bacterium]
MAVTARGEELRFDFPLPRTHTGIALGNGAVGCLVWGGARLHLTLNHIAFWDHRGGETLLEGTTYERLKAAYDPGDQRTLEAAFLRRRRPEGVLRSMRLPFGRFEFGFRDGLVPLEGRLHWPTGRLRIATAGGELELALLPDADALLLADPDGLVSEIGVHTCWEHVGEELARYRFEPPHVVT